MKWILTTSFLVFMDGKVFVGDKGGAFMIWKIIKFYDGLKSAIFSNKIK